MSMVEQHFTLLVLLDLSAAFDTIYRDKLIGRLESDLGITDNALAWFKSDLSDRFQRASVNGSFSDQFPLKQGSCLGPLLFTIYVISNAFASICLENQRKCLSKHLLHLVLIIVTVFCMGCPTTSLTNWREF